MAYSEQLADRLRIALNEKPGIAERKMFGGICIMLNGNMLCGTSNDDFMFRVGADGVGDALEQPGARPVQFGDRKPMSGFVFVKATEAEGDLIDDWIARARAFVDTLPAK